MTKALVIKPDGPQGGQAGRVRAAGQAERSW